MAQDYPALRPFFDEAGARFAEVLTSIEEHGPALRAILRGDGPARFDQDWFPRLDAAAAYALVRREKPARIIEIGSGHSTRFMARAIADVRSRPGSPASIPRRGPRLPRSTSSGFRCSCATPIRLRSQSLGAATFCSSIRAISRCRERTWTDFFSTCCRASPAECCVHVHDITLPEAYPVEWAWRGYNEQLLVGALLQGRGYELLFASHFVNSKLPASISEGVLAEIPISPGAHETSLWMRKR